MYFSTTWKISHIPISKAHTWVNDYSLLPKVGPFSHSQLLWSLLPHVLVWRLDPDPTSSWIVTWCIFFKQTEVSWYHAARSTFRLEHSLVYQRASKATPAPILSATKRRTEKCHSVILFFDILISWSNLHRVWRSWKLISDVSPRRLLTYPEFWGYQDVACWLVQWWTSCESCHSIFHHAYRREVWPKQWHLLGLWRHVRKICVVVFRPKMMPEI